MSNFVVAGVCGQGTVLASKLIAQAALLDGRDVRTAETIGMAQRGGSVLGHVRTSPAESLDAPLSPLVARGTADCLISFEPAEAVRALAYVQQGGTVVCAQQALQPVIVDFKRKPYDGSDELAYLRACAESGRLATAKIVDGAAICAELGSTRVLNVVLLGAAFATGAFDVSEQSLIAALETLVKPKLVDLNKTALRRGMNA
jgi:indolepyruvate ferredoxin oxidoreductase beta subunit